MKKFSIRKIMAYVLAAIQFIVMITLIVQLAITQMIPVGYLVIGAVLLLILLLVIIISQRNKVTGIIAMILSAILTLGMGYGNYMLYHTNWMLDQVTNVTVQVDTINLYVLNEDKAETVEDVAGYQFGILAAGERQSTDEVVQSLEDELSVELNIKEYDTVTDLADAIQNGSIQAILINVGYMSMLDDIEGYETFTTKLKIISDRQVETEIVVSNEDKAKEIQGGYVPETFSVFISGIDTYGPVTTKDRSDVNIIATVNTKTHQVLLLSTPRDYYVPLSISNGREDKLTHAGIYGIDVSMDTLELLYDMEIDYYVRLNFSGFMDIVDSLGGINVNSENAFTAITGDSYIQGVNHLNGERALAFARERYAFKDGDLQRGRNQMAVIQAIIKKALSSDLLLNYADVMNSIAGSFQTNMSDGMIGGLVKQQLESGKGWNVVTYQTTGSGSKKTCYSSRKKRTYVMIPNYDTVEQAKIMMQQVEDGDVVSESTEVPDGGSRKLMECW